MILGPASHKVDGAGNVVENHCSLQLVEWLGRPATNVFVGMCAQLLEDNLSSAVKTKMHTEIMIDCLNGSVVYLRCEALPIVRGLGRLARLRSCQKKKKKIED